MTKDQILGGLLNLSRTDLEAVQAACNGLLGANVKGPSPLGQAIYSALGAVTGAARPYASLTPALKKQFEGNLAIWETFLNNELVGWDRNKLRRDALLRMLFSLLKDDLEKRGVSPTMGILISNMGRIQETFDASFPGYREAGIAAEKVLRHFG